MSVDVKIQRIDNYYYSFKLSSAKGIKIVARYLTFKNPSDFAHRRNVEMFDKRALTFRIGMLPTLVERLREEGVEYEVKDYGWDMPKGVKIDSRLTGNYIHQSQAVQAFFRRRFGIIVVPTRGGKTFIAAEVVRIWLEKFSGTFMFLTDSTTLHSQAVADFRNYFERYGGISIGEVKAGHTDLSKRITVAMIQSVQSTLSRRCSDRKKQRELKKYLSSLSFLCVDEIHDNSSDSKLKLYKKCRNLDFQLCLSATPYRSGAFLQNLKLMAWSGDVCYTITEETLRQRKVLSDYQVVMPLIDHDSQDYSDVVQEYENLRQRLIYDNEERNAILLKLIKWFESEGLKTLVLFQSVKHGEKISELTGYTFVKGSTTNQKREESKAKFLSEDGGVLLASNIFKKGVTLPQVEVLINADEGLEDANTIQRKGRVLGATERKTRSLVVDFFDEYELYFTTHSLTRLSVYTESVGENNVSVFDTGVDDWFDAIKKLTKKWFKL